MKTVFIYALNDPETGECRYVGKAKNPKRRYSSHMANAAREKYYCANWVKSLLSKGLRPVLEVLDEVPESEWPQWEIAYIEFFRESGFALVNGNAGGKGGYAPSAEVRLKKRAAKLGTKDSDEVRLKKSLVRKGMKFSDTHCKNISLSKSGVLNPGFGKKVSKSICAKRCRKRARSASKFLGVTRRNKKWQARCGRKGSHLGNFEFEEDAARAYDAKARELFGEFASPNFPI